MVTCLVKFFKSKQYIEWYNKYRIKTKLRGM
ncbi:IS3 family transposase [Peptoniphilus genitalis]